MKNQRHYQGSETSYPPGAPTDPRRCGWKAEEEDCFIICKALRGQNLKSRFWTRVWTQDYGDIFRKHPPDLKVTCTLIDIKFFEVSDKQNLRNKLEMITWWEHFEI